MQSKIGIFLGHAPGHLKGNEGIVKLFLSLLNSKQFQNIVIAVPNWSFKEIHLLLKEKVNVNPENIEILSTGSRIHYSFFIWNQCKKLLKKLSTRRSTAKKSYGKYLDSICKVFLKLSSRYFLFFILLLPILISTILFYFIWNFSEKLLFFLKKKYGSRIKDKIKKIPRSLLQPLAKIKNNFFVRRFYSEVKEREFKRLVKLINRRKDIKVWYIPAACWPEISKIKAKKIIAIPDVVFVEFPFLFSGVINEFNYQKIKSTLRIDAQFICFSEHVKKHHLTKLIEPPREKVTIVRHGYTDLSFHLKQVKENPTDAALQIMDSFQKTQLHNHPYLKGFYLPSMRFIFYSSQVRPHKNFLNLVKAYEVLLRKRFVNIKLVITGNPAHQTELNNYIHSRRLQYDILSLYDVADEVLAALNHLAICAVNPTLFEGGFPFTFSEAYSVGTPSVMSRIPVVLEESEDESLNSIMLFDPYSVDDMVNKIEWGVKNRDDLYQLQRGLYEKFAVRNWDIVAKEYVDLFEHAEAPVVV